MHRPNPIARWVVAAFIAAAACGARAAEPRYKFLKEIPVGGGGAWDYLHADVAGHRNYLTHGTKVVVIDTEHDKVVGDIPTERGGRAR